jgi:hypothetical protein
MGGVVISLLFPQEDETRAAAAVAIRRAHGPLLRSIDPDPLFAMGPLRLLVSGPMIEDGPAGGK